MDQTALQTISALRLSRSMSQEELAAQSGVDLETIKLLERNYLETLSQDEAWQIISVLECGLHQVNWLCTEIPGIELPPFRTE